MGWVQNEKWMLESRSDEWTIDAQARAANRLFQTVRSSRDRMGTRCTEFRQTCHAPPQTALLAIRLGEATLQQSNGFAIWVAGGLKLDLQLVEIFLGDPGDVAAGRPAVQFPRPFSDPGLEEG